MVNCCGLVSIKNEPVPLKSIVVEVLVQGHVATVTSTLQYENKEESPLEAIFVFPLPGEAALCHFSAKIGQTEVVAQVQEKQKAKEEYDDALASGQQAFLLEESDQSPDIFQLSVGSLPPGESASVTLAYVTELAVQADDGLRLCLPAVLNPRYTPRDDVNATPVQVTSVPAGCVPYTLDLNVQLFSPSPVSKVESNCSLDPLKYLNKEKTQATVSLSSGHKFDRDVELLVYYGHAHQPTAVVEAGLATAKPGSLMGDPMVMLSLYPQFPADVMSSLTSRGEFLFLVDRSGSMDCPMHSGEGAQMRIESARDTLLLLLKSLPMGCYFNIHCFGSGHDSFFPKSVEYSQSTMDEALAKVKEMLADMGGTEILQPLKHIYSQPCIPGQPRQLFVFTDGEVYNTKEILDLVKKNADYHRCFTFGIGEGASSALITGMAKEGSGHTQFITGTERMQPKVMQSLRFALQPAVVDISVKWQVPKGMSVTPVSTPIRVIFQGQRALLYAQLTGTSSGETEASVTVQYRLAEKPVHNQLSFSLKPVEGSGLTIHRLGARSLIRSLEMEERAEGGGGDGEKKNRLVELSVQSGVSSAFTAFIAVHKGTGLAVQGPLMRRNIPTPFVGRRMMGVMACMPMAMACSLPSPVKKSGMKMRSSKKASDSGLYGKSSDAVLGGLPNEYSQPPPADLLLQLISLQKASGAWDLEPALAEVFGKTEEEVAKQKPAQANTAVWATVLALIWLHGFRMEARDEWQFLVMKAASWLQAQKVTALPECVLAGNALLGCQVQKDALGL